MLHHVSSRWLTHQSAVKCIVKQWSTLYSYFKHLPNKDKVIIQKEQYKEIMRLLENPRCHFQLEFIADIAVMYNNFLWTFQYEDQLVQVLYAVVNDLVRSLMLRFVTTAVVATKTGQELVDLDVHELKNIGDHLTKLRSTDATKKSIVENNKGAARWHSNHCASLLHAKRPILAEECTSNKYRLGRSMRWTFSSRVWGTTIDCYVVSSSEMSVLMDEWKLYSVNDRPKNWYRMDLFQTPESDDCIERTKLIVQNWWLLSKGSGDAKAAGEMKHEDDNWSPSCIALFLCTLWKCPEISYILYSH